MAALPPPPPPPSGKREREDEDGSLDATEPLAKRSRYSEQAAEILADLWGGLYDGVVSMAVDGMDYVESDPDLALFRRLEEAKDRDDVLRITKDVTQAQRDRLMSPLLDLIFKLKVLRYGPEMSRELAREPRLDRIQFCLDRGLDQAMNPNIHLQYAAEAGRVDLLKFFLSRGAHVDGREIHQGTPSLSYSFVDASPLNMAITNGRTEAVKFLLDHGADANLPSKNNSASMRLAIRHGHVEIVRLLIERGAQIRDHPEYLESAIFSGNPDLVRFLQDQGLSFTINGYDLLEKAINSNSPPMVGYLMDTGSITPQVSEMALYYAFVQQHQRTRGATKDFTMINFLLARGLDLHREHDVLLLTTSRWHDPDLVRFILDHGGDIRPSNHEIVFGMYTNCKAYDPDYMETLRLVRDRGVDFNVLTPRERQDFERMLGKRIEDV